MWFSPEKLRYGLLGNWWCHVIDSCLIDFCADATKAAPLRVHLLEKKKKKMSAIWVLNVKTPMTRVSKSKPDTCAVMPFVLCDGWTHCIKWATCKQAHSHCSKLHTAGEQDNTRKKTSSIVKYDVFHHTSDHLYNGLQEMNRQGSKHRTWTYYKNRKTQ